MRQAKRKVFLIIDRHPVHRARKVKAWLEKNAHRIRRFYLPGYSPELNPDEMLNQDVKSNALGRQRPGNQDELTKKLPDRIIRLVTFRNYEADRQRHNVDFCPEVDENHHPVAHS